MPDVKVRASLSGFSWIDAINEEIGDGAALGVVEVKVDDDGDGVVGVGVKHEVVADQERQNKNKIKIFFFVPSFALKLNLFQADLNSVSRSNFKMRTSFEQSAINRKLAIYFTLW